MKSRINHPASDSVKTSLKVMLFSCLMVFSLISCKKDDPPSTTYEIVNHTPNLSYEVDPLLNGSLYEVIVYMYNDENEILYTDKIDVIASGGGTSEIIKATPAAKKVKVSFKMFPLQSAFYNSDYNARLYMAEFSYLKQGSNNVIQVDFTTMVDTKLSNRKNNFKIQLSKAKDAAFLK